ncbi:MAG: hypothetical protein AAF196_08735 [Planctomycetota bacterium]
MRLRHLLALAIAVSASGCGGNALEFRVETDFEVPKSVQTLEFHIGGAGLVISDRDDGDARIDVVGTVVAVSLEDEVEARFGEDYVATPRFSISEDGLVGKFEPPALPEGLELHVDSSLILQLQILVPPGIALRLYSDAGRTRIQLNGHVGDAEVIADGGGELLLRNCEGHVSGRYGDGNLQAFDHRGSLDLHTGKGKIWARIAEIGPQGIRLRADTPSLICFLPEDAAFDLDAKTIMSRGGKVGVICSAFDLPVERVHSSHPEDASRGEVLGHRAQGQVRGGGPLVDLQVQFGHLSVTKTEP